MMSEVAHKGFDFHGSQVRILLIDGTPWWVARDVCAVLGIADTRQVAERLPLEDRYLAPVLDARGVEQQTWVVNESGLYELIFRSDKPTARDFRRWVTSDVLPEIRKTGGYALTPQTYAEALRAAADAWDESERQKQVAIDAKAYADKLEPKAEEYDAYIEAEGVYTLAEAAQLMCYTSGAAMGRTRLIGRLRDLGILCQPAPGERPRPKQEYRERGWFELHPTQYQQGRRTVTYMQTFVTPTGVSAIYRVLVADGEDLVEPELP